MRLLSWNVNGIRAVYRKGFMEWFTKEQPDILALQETKAWGDQVPLDLRWSTGYHTYFSQPERKGYSGVALFSKEKPLNVGYSLDSRFDPEGRLIQAEYPGFTLLNVYFPNGGMSDERLKYKLDFYDAFLEHMESLRADGRKIIFCGDVNTAHEEIDLARPKPNMKNSGFMRVERDWIDKVVERGYVDTFRAMYPEKRKYSWWDQKTSARERDVGWRIDYFFTSPDLKIKDAYILSDVTGSDHCPVGLEI